MMLSVKHIGDLDAACGARVQSDWRSLTQEMIDTFADVTGDHQWVHVDRVRASAESPYHTTIAHGFLTLGLLSAMLGECFSTAAAASINYGLDRIRFVAPVPSGSRVRGNFTLAGVSRNGEAAADLTWNVEVEIEGTSKPALVATWIIRVIFSPP